MCRLFSYISVNPILLEDVLIHPIYGITQQVQAEFLGETFLNADGFGVTWHTDARGSFNPFEDNESSVKRQNESEASGGPIKVKDGHLLPFVRGPHPATYKTTIAKPLNDPTFLSLCANTSSKCIFAHLRAACSPPVAYTNNHPFVFGRHCFMHNGLVSDFPEIRKEMLQEISKGFTRMIHGSTDTEHLAALYMTYLCTPEDSHGAGEHYTASSMWQAMKRTIKTVEDIQTGLGLTPDNFLNICATDGESQFALCYRSQVSKTTPPFDLFVSVEAADVLNRKPYADKHGIMYKDNRSPDELHKAARDLRQNANPVVDPDNAAEYKALFPDLRRLLEEEGMLHPVRHGPHVIVSSEPTTLSPGWFKLCNGDAILVDTVQTEKFSRLSVSAESF